jgi:hypothetical protein
MGTAADVHARESQDAFGRSFLVGRIRWGRPQDSADGGQRRLLTRGREPTVIADLHEMVREDPPSDEATAGKL